MSSNPQGICRARRCEIANDVVEGKSKRDKPVIASEAKQSRKEAAMEKQV